MKAFRGEVFSDMWKKHIPDDFDRLIRMLDCIPIEETNEENKEEHEQNKIISNAVGIKIAMMHRDCGK